MPGLGHDGVGLYGTLTNTTMRRMIERVECEDRTHVDVGAADGKVRVAWVTGRPLEGRTEGPEGALP